VQNLVENWRRNSEEGHLTSVHERVNRSSLRERLESRSSIESAEQGLVTIQQEIVVPG
jgi:hypothetical protein